jgi:hypothetical protein
VRHPTQSGDQTLARRNPSGFTITETLDRLIAAAIMGDNMIPVKG